MTHHLRLLSLGAVLLAVLTMLAGCASSQPSTTTGGAAKSANGPKIAVNEDSFDFDKVPLDKVVSRTFQIKNVGTAPLILNGKPTVRAVQGC